MERWLNQSSKVRKYDSVSPDERKVGNMNIGFIGMGIIGSRMAINLLAAGNNLTINNRTRKFTEPLFYLDLAGIPAGSLGH